MQEKFRTLVRFELIGDDFCYAVVSIFSAKIIKIPKSKVPKRIINACYNGQIRHHVKVNTDVIHADELVFEDWELG